MKKFRIVTQLSVVLERSWVIEAESEDAALDAFEEDQESATFEGEKVINIIGDETVQGVELVPEIENPVTLRFQPQAWVNDYAVSAGDCR